MNTISRKPRVGIVDCIVITPEVHNKLSEKREEPNHNKSPKKAVKLLKTTPEYSTTVKNRVLLINKELSNKNLPYRYTVYKEKNRLIVEAIVLDIFGEPAQRYPKIVTPDNYKTILDSMLSGSGFFYDD